MALTFQVVMENGRLRPLNPLPLREGEQAEITLVFPEDVEPEETLAEVLRDIREESDRHSPEWWDDFDQFIRDNRVNFVERT